MATFLTYLSSWFGSTDPTLAALAPNGDTVKLIKHPGRYTPAAELNTPGVTLNQLLLVKLRHVELPSPRLIFPSRNLLVQELFEHKKSTDEGTEIFPSPSAIRAAAAEARSSELAKSRVRMPPKTKLATIEE